MTKICIAIVIVSILVMIAFAFDALFLLHPANAADMLRIGPI